jgi:hypothetical protein
MMPGPHRPGQIVKIAMTGFTPILLLRRLGGIPTLLGEGSGAAVRAPDPVGPAPLANGFVTLDLVQQILKVDPRGGTDGRGLENSFRVTPDRCRGELFSTVWNLY